jgi:hypothetical protein
MDLILKSLDTSDERLLSPRSLPVQQPLSQEHKTLAKEDAVKLKTNAILYFCHTN